eukprot:TRINITY_DN4213_c0_g1_i1.p1 TRINITY_DN4213_c0_g1~~TRINITY_DN4213_c0_g1_i1.p1  ORF type:complete len:364 (-),score=36.41 TRINITY_DN4213_c0_g1_i1:58-1149(-)
MRMVTFDWTFPSRQFCELLIDSASLAKLGDGHQCQIASDRSNEIIITLGDAPTLDPMQTIKLNPKVLYTKNCPIVQSIQLHVNISANESIYPTLVMIQPSMLGVCTPLQLSPSSLLFVGKRPLQKAEWSIVESKPTLSASDTQKIQTLMNTDANSNKLDIYLPPGTLPLDYSFVLKVIMTNFLGRANSSLVAVRTSSLALPKVTISESKLELYTSDSLVIEAVGEAQSCSNELQGTTPFKLKYKWTDISVNPIDIERVIGLNPQIPPRSLTIPAFTFEARSIRTLQVKVWIESNPNLENTQSVEVKYLIAKPIAWIQGGSRIISTSQELLLDASPSYDPDEPDLRRSRDLNFTWSCTLSLIHI